MSQHADLKRYELFGWDYAAVNPLTEAEVAWHVMWARRAGPPVLVLACGTGRLACELARAGFPTVGLDLCDAMLALAAEQAAQLPPDAGARVRFVRGDMADFDLGEQFGLVCIPDNSLRELPARQRIVSCLACIRRHVRPDGVALVTERRFDPSLYADGPRRIGWSRPVPHPRTGEMVCRRIEVALADDGRGVRGNMIYRTARRDGSEAIEECPFESLVLTVDDYQAAFAEAGLEARVCCGYAERDDDGREATLCFVSRRAH